MESDFPWVVLARIGVFGVNICWSNLVGALWQPRLPLYREPNVQLNFCVLTPRDVIARDVTARDVTASDVTARDVKVRCGVLRGARRWSLL